jgi:hypothetical protein
MTKQMIFTFVLLSGIIPFAQAEITQDSLRTCLEKISELTIKRVELDFPGHKYTAARPTLASSDEKYFWFSDLATEIDSPDGAERTAFLITTVDRECNIVNPPTPEM